MAAAAQAASVAGLAVALTAAARTARVPSLPVAGESGARDLAIAVGVIVALARFAPEGFIWPIAVVLLAAVYLGSLQIVGEADPAARSAGVAIESVLVPAAAAVAALGALRLVPIGVVLAPAFVLAGGLVGLTLVTELRIARASGPPSSTERTAVQIEILLVGFLGFAGVAALVPGGLPQPGETGSALAPAPVAWVAQAGGDALIAFLLAYRTAALRSTSFRDVAWFALTGAVIVAVAAVALRSIELPRILGPAMLVLVFFLWDAIHSGGRTRRRRDPWRIWETALLAVLAIAVIGWTLGQRG
jgi:hypothetical protein